MSRSGPVVAAVLVAGAALACAGPEPPVGGAALFTPELLPDALVEGNAIALPPALGGNRFLSGWRPAARDGRPALRPAGGRGRIEWVQLVARPRTLALDLDLGSAGPAGRSVGIRAAGRDLGTVPLASPLRIPLPDDLPLGRVVLDLLLEDAPGLAPPVISAARLRPAAPAGDLRWDGGEIVQSATSLLDYVRPVPGGAVLAGVIELPARGGGSQSFRLEVTGPGGEEIGAAAFTPGRWSRRPGRRPIELPLGEEPGLRRFRFVATGEPGPPARWRDLRIVAGGGPPAPPPARTAAEPPRRVILYVMDALRADQVGHLGGPAGISPALDRLAAGGATFLDHRSVAPNTLPSTKALFVGRAFVRRGGGKLRAAGPPTLAELFRRAGYRTGLFSGNVYVGPAYGTDRGFDHVATGLGVADGTSSFNDTAERVHRAALAWLEGLGPEERAFAYLHTIHPHNPYAPPPDFADRFTAGIRSEIDGETGTLLDVKHRRRGTTGADRERLRSLYAASFAYNDRELERFVERLDRLAPPGEALLAVTSDHGEELFDHGGVLHGYTLYEEMVRIPLVLRAPGRIAPARIERPSDTLDLHATLLELCRLDASAGSDGRPLLEPPAAGDRETVRFAAASSLRGGIFSARSASWKVVWAPRGGRGWGMGEGLGRSRDPEYLFDLAADPGETVNLAGAGDLEAAWLRSRLLAWIERGAEPAGDGEQAAQDEATLRQLRALGYLN
jgi:arylsulfatase A-like enzyme